MGNVSFNEIVGLSVCLSDCKKLLAGNVSCNEIAVSLASGRKCMRLQNASDKKCPDVMRLQEASGRKCMRLQNASDRKYVM